MTIGQKIEKLRKQKGWTQKEFGELLGVDQTTVSRIESDDRAFKIAELEEICKVLKISVRKFFLGLYN